MGNLLKKSGYSNKAVDLYINKVNLFKIKEADTNFLYTGFCGDTMEFFLKINDDKIIDASFLTIGCGGDRVAGSALTEMIKNKTLEEAEGITEEEILNYSNGLPTEKKDAFVWQRVHWLKH